MNSRRLDGTCYEAFDPDGPATQPAAAPSLTAPRAAKPERTGEQVLADAVRVLTEAARLTRPVLAPAENTGAGHGPAWVDSGQREQADWAEFVTHALAGAAANIGGIEAALNGRPGSWEADHVRNLLTSTVGHDEAYLLEHRTEPVAVDLYVEVILVDLEVWTAYDQASTQLVARYDAISPDINDERDRQRDAITKLEEGLERQRVDDWTDYGHALAPAVQAAAERMPGLRVPVSVYVDLDTFPEPNDPADDRGHGLVDRLREAAITDAPLLDLERAPLERLQP